MIKYLAFFILPVCCFADPYFDIINNRYKEVREEHLKEWDKNRDMEIDAWYFYRVGVLDGLKFSIDNYSIEDN